ncbi:PREDICTED: protein BOLA4, chloroplastic/mitochondrial [Tarenaya hassleriana]|uniref:protein BOLA4, chloroplastic/mitochondrial n=1 Tax=Tarenaya hassleriana TaxID=28532 RepID=UPI00053C5471|nr:PREDICTED: protein BOLA4, chloroplastic/mitochondrial [Tarenaya hassleriana]
MAKSLMATTRPYVFLSTSSSLRLLSRSQKKPFASSSAAAVSLATVRNNNCNCASPVLSCRLLYGEAAASIYSGGVPRVYGFDGASIRRHGFSTRASFVNDAGSINQPLMESMEKKIKEELNAESVSVKDMSGDGRHVCIDVVSSAFEGQSTVNRQRMVYKAIWAELQNVVHAVDQMTTKTPSEAESQK